MKKIITLNKIVNEKGQIALGQAFKGIKVKIILNRPLNKEEEVILKLSKLRKKLEEIRKKRNNA